MPLPAPVTPAKSSISITKTPSKTPNVYTPKEMIGFDVVMSNKGKGFSTDTHFEDLLADIVTEVAGSTEKAQAILKWQPVTVSYSLPASFALSGKEINDDKGYFNDFVIAPGDTVTLHLEGQVIDTSLGDITNSATYKEIASATSGSDEATYSPSAGVLGLEKTAPLLTYVSGNTTMFTVLVSNTGTGWLNDVAIEDDLSVIRVETIGGKLVKAFKPDTLVVTNDSDPSLITLTTTDNKLSATADIAPHSTVTFTLKATVSNLALGTITITNTAKAKANELTGEVTLSQTSGKVLFKKEAVTPNYAVGGEVQFLMILNNRSADGVNNAVLTDVIKGIKVLSSDGTEKPAFSYSKVEISKSEGGVSVIDNVTGDDFKPIENADLSVTVDLLKYSSVQFSITATVIADAIGDIINKAVVKIDDKVVAGDVVMVQPYPVDIVLNKQSKKPVYSPSKELSFTISISNVSENILYQQVLKDDMMATQVMLADGTTGNAFVEGSVSLEEDDIPITSTSTKLDDISYELTIFPHDTLTFIAKGTVVDNAVGDIMNTAYFDGDIPSNKVPREVPKILGEFTTDRSYYIPGAPLEYHLKLMNVSDFPAFGVQLESQFTLSRGQYITGVEGRAFDSGTITATTDGGDDSNAGDFDDNQDIKTNLSISAGGFVEYVIKPAVDIDMTTPISVDAYYNVAFDVTGVDKVKPGEDGHAIHLAAPDVPPVGGKLQTKKIADKKVYDVTDEKVIYTLTAVNIGVGNMPDVRLTDDLSSLVSAKSGKPIFTTWTFTAYETLDGVETVLPADKQPPANQNLDMRWNFENQSRNSLRIVVDAVLGSDIQDDVTNLFAAFDGGGSKVSEADVTTAITQKGTGDNQLIVTKTVKQPQIQPNGMAEYEILVENPNDRAVDNFSVEDHIPAGFRYVEGSARVSYSQAGVIFPSLSLLHPWLARV